jgi:hypothetical protein
MCPKIRCDIFGYKILGSKHSLKLQTQTTEVTKGSLILLSSTWIKKMQCRKRSTVRMVPKMCIILLRGNYILAPILNLNCDFIRLLSLCIFTLTIYRRSLILPLLHKQHITVSTRQFCPCEYTPNFLKLCEYTLICYYNISTRIWIRIWQNFDSIMTHKSKLKPYAYIYI